MACTVFEYLYRDADNHKAFGKVAFEGAVHPELWDSALRYLDCGTNFIAEQVGLPSLYDQLYQWSGGAPTDADHCWHEFVSVSVVAECDLTPSVPRLGEAKAFIDRLSSVEDWHIWLSPNVECGMPEGHNASS